MVSDTPQVEVYCSMVSQIQIGWAVQWIGRVLPGYCFSLGSTMISWSSRKQGSVAQSTAEAEYIAASAAGREAVWLRKLLSDLFSSELEPTVIHCDNQSSIKC
jgi:hypothetical protein